MSRKHWQQRVIRVVTLLIAFSLGSSLMQAMVPAKKKKNRTVAAAKALPVKKVALNLTTPRIASSARPGTAKKAVLTGPWRVPNFADSTEGDKIDGEDLAVRRAAVDALGRMNGAVVVSDPDTGRVLAMVNQKLALKSGFQPCSTIKVPVALAALSENIVDRTTMIRVYGRTSFNLTTALAKSNNQYFASLGQKLGFERVSYYAKLFGLGEKAGLDIDGEQPGILPQTVPKSGMGMMTSFGDGISLTPLEYAALIGAVANGGTLYYLQHPKSQTEAEGMLPQVKRRLDIDEWIPEIKPGMMGAVEYGTARRIGFDPNEPIYGKTGTCTDSRSPTHLGWFGSFTELGKNRLVVVVLLTGGNLVSGPTASGIAGQVYKNLGVESYFAQTRPGPATASLSN
ncbi:MAG: penicillin-binding transpeptidase domain-containing protein [Bryobacteraceae bacterium]